MLRRILIALSLILMPALASADVLGDAFNGLSDSDRLAAQQSMQAGGLYQGPTDGSFSPAVKAGIQETWQQIFTNGYDGPAYDLTSSKGATSFLKAVASGKLSAWIQG